MLLKVRMLDQEIEKQWADRTGTQVNRDKP